MKRSARPPSCSMRFFPLGTTTCTAAVFSYTLLFATLRGHGCAAAATFVPPHPRSFAFGESITGQSLFTRQTRQSFAGIRQTAAARAIALDLESETATATETNATRDDDFIKAAFEAGSKDDAPEQQPKRNGNLDDRVVSESKLPNNKGPSSSSSSSPSMPPPKQDDRVLLPQARPFPLGMIVDQTEIKHALLLAAINPRMGGIVISGSRGTGKSVLARAMRRLLPTHIERIRGNRYNVDPEGKEGIDSILQSVLEESPDGVAIDDLETEMVETPFVQIPLNVMEDSLLGTVDLEASIEQGRTIFSPGLLAKAHRGILYVDEINLLDEEAANILLNVIADGYVNLEREGLSVRYPCRPLLIATFNPEEGELRDHLIDRIAVSLSADAAPLSIEERVRAVDNVLGFSGGTEEQTSTEAAETLRGAEEEETVLREAIVSARELLPRVDIDGSQILYLCEEATLAGCEGQRAEIFATEVAKTSAALHGRTRVNADDLRTGVMLAIAPRGMYVPEAPLPGDQTAPSPDRPQSPLEPLPPPPDIMDEERNEEEGEQEDEHEEEEGQENEPEEETSQEEEEFDLPQEFMFGVSEAPIDPRLLKFNQWTRRKAKGGKRSRIFNLERGRYVKPIFPKGGGRGKLAVGATLRAAAPYQKFRRTRAIGTAKEDKLVYIEKDDFRIKRMARKAGSLIVFLVDASGSMALNRMDAAKGAALSLLSEAYKCRDKISLISFHGERAEVLVPPTKSMALTKNRLEGMPCGGGSPLAHALTTAMRTGLNTMKIKQDVGRVVIVLLTDGRANMPMSISLGGRFDPKSDPESKDGMPSRKYLKDEVMACAKQLAALSDFNLLVVDTEDQFVGTGIAKEFARIAGGNYFHLAQTDSSAVAKITERGVEAARVR